MKIIFFGSIRVAKDILKKIIVPNKNIELLGVVCEKTVNPWRNEQNVHDFAVSNEIPILGLQEIKRLDPDLGISVRFNKIIDKDIIAQFKFGIVNTHGGILPEYRGSYCNINALLNKDSNFGVTLHYIEEGIDTGDIVDIIQIPIEDEHTGFDLYLASEKMCFDIINDNINELLVGKNDRISQAELIANGRKTNTYRAKKTIAKKLIDIKQIDNNIHVIKAFDSPHHEPAYTYINGKKIYLRVRY